jgi:hypothetical protein
MTKSEHHRSKNKRRRQIEALHTDCNCSEIWWISGGNWNKYILAKKARANKKLMTHYGTLGGVSTKVIEMMIEG